MSFYLTITSSTDTPLFSHEFGTSKSSGDGIARFSDASRHLNPFIVHASLDMVDELQWASSQMYMKVVDRFYNNHISCFVTGSNVRFLLLHQPPIVQQGRGSTVTSGGVAANPTSAATEEAIRLFFLEVYEAWVKMAMSPFYRLGEEIRSEVFRGRVAAAGKKYL